MTVAVSRSRRPSRSPHSSRSPSSVSVDWRRSRCRSAASMRRGRRSGSRRAATNAPPSNRPVAPDPTVPRSRCSGTAHGSSRGSVHPHRSYQASWWRQRRLRCPNLARDDRGSATVFAVALIVVVIGLMTGGAAVGAAVIGRHRAQSAADPGRTGRRGRLGRRTRPILQPGQRRRRSHGQPGRSVFGAAAGCGGRRGGDGAVRSVESGRGAWAGPRRARLTAARWPRR